MRGFFVALGSSEWQERAASCAALHPNRYSEIIFITHCISSTSSVRIHPLKGLPARVPHHVRRRAGVTFGDRHRRALCGRLQSCAFIAASAEQSGKRGGRRMRYLIRFFFHFAGARKVTKKAI